MINKTLLLKENAKKFDIVLTDEQLVKFDKFADFITEFNAHTNLLSSNDVNLLYEKHFLDSISIFKIIDANQALLDLSVNPEQLTYFYEDSGLTSRKYTYMDTGSLYGDVDGGLSLISISNLMPNSFNAALPSAVILLN